MAPGKEKNYDSKSPVHAKVPLGLNVKATIGNGVTSVGRAALMDRTPLESVAIPGSVSNSSDPVPETASSGSLLDRIDDDSVWDEFLARRSSHGFDNREYQFLLRMRDDEGCRSICSSVSNGYYRFSTPRKKRISKNGSSKKRTVYQFEPREMTALKIVAHLMYGYDRLFSPDLYSFRRNVSAADAVRRLSRTAKLDSMWGCKLDIHDYFNSIDVAKLLPELERDLADERLYRLFEGILANPNVICDGEIVEERKGVMAGVPLSAFLANYYLRDVDEFFGSRDCIYMRYADDILIMADSEEAVMGLRGTLIGLIEAKGLEMNPDKERLFAPGEELEFLGFSISKNRIDISANTLRKMKGKIRRSARSIRRWMFEKNAPVEGTIRALIRDYNRRFYGCESGEYSWAAWYFSSITTTDSLHEIDLHFQEWTRYVATGRHNKRNYTAVPYDMLRSCGYRPLVSEYYKHTNPERP